MEGKYQLHVVDYVVICLMLALSAATGVYHRFAGGRQKTTHEYLLGNRQIGAFPVGISVFISIISAITFIGTPAEVYVNGPTFGLAALSSITVGLIISRTYIPVFYRLQVTSIYEYLDMRFSKVVRMTALVISLVTGFIYMSFVIYAPALAISSVTDLSIDIAIVVMGLVCTFYSTIGGIKAVVWADVIQAAIMVIGLFVLIIVGCVEAGGFDEVIDRLEAGERTQVFDFNPDPTIRHSFWAIMIGGVFQAVYTAGVNQLVVQRNLCCKSENQAVLAAWIGVAGVAFARSLAVICGLVMFAYYAICDPLEQGVIVDHDQLVGRFIVDLVGVVPGVAGLILAAVFSATLSTVSSGVNAVSANISEDLIKPHFKYNERCLTLVTKTIAAVCGLIATGLAKGVPYLGTNLLEGALGFIGILSGPVLGIFSLGMFFPRANTKGAMIGLVFGALLGYFFLVGSFLFPLRLTGLLPYLNYDCPIMNATTDMPITTAMSFTTGPLVTTEELMATSLSCINGSLPTWFCKLCNVSYMYYGCFTCLLTMLVGIIVSLLTGPTDPRTLNPDLFCSLPGAFCCCFPTRCTSWFCSSVGRDFEGTTKTGYDNYSYEPEVNGHAGGGSPGLFLNNKTDDTHL